MRVCRHDEATGDAELGGQAAGGGQACTRPQGARADGVAELPLELPRQRLAPASVEPGEELDGVASLAQLVQNIGTKLDLNNGQIDLYLGGQMTRTPIRITVAVSIAASAVLVAATPGAGSDKPTGSVSVVARIETGNGPCSEVGGFGYLWVANNRDGTLVRIDPATNAVTGKIDVGPGPCGVAIAGGSVWVDGYSSASVVRVDPQTLKVIKRIPMGDEIWDITVGAGSVWATGTQSNFVARINPRTNKVTRKISVPFLALLGRKIYRINPRTNKLRSILVGKAPRSVAVSNTAVWVSNAKSNTVSRINPRRLRVVATIRVGKAPDNAAIADDGTVFVPNNGSNTVSRIDPATNHVIEVVPVGRGPFPAAAAFGDIWVPSAAGTEIDRLHIG